MSFLSNPHVDPATVVMSTDPRVCILMNGRSGSGDAAELEKRFEAAFERHPGRFELRVLSPRSGIADACQRALKDGFGTIAAAGGDGTIAAVAGQVAGSGRRFGIVPQGTFNYVARGFDIPEDLDEAVDLIATGETRPLPVGEVNGQIFLNNASLGVYPQVLETREGTYRRWGRSRLAAHWSLILTVLSFRSPMRMKVTAGGREVRRKTPLAFVARSAFQLEQFGLEGADEVRAGRFALFLAPDCTRWQLLARAFRLAVRGMELDRDFELFTGEEIVIETLRRRTQTVAMDGERVTLRAPFRFRMHRDVLHTILPPERPAAPE
ncbi:diacylglycerol/lipid kinase family protein [Roseivivax isoporae]|nr:diacylglycerol kinase family protein [Roseivivax isoporae]